MTSVQALITILAIAVGTQFTRWLPFWLFPEKKDPPAVVLQATSSSLLESSIAGASRVLFSIAGGTVLYMVLV